MLRVLLDRYAACKSSKDVVEVQDAWLQECEKEKVERLTQGIRLLDNSVVVFFFVFVEDASTRRGAKEKSHHCSLCLQLQRTKINDF